MTRIICTSLSLAAVASVSAVEQENVMLLQTSKDEAILVPDGSEDYPLPNKYIDDFKDMAEWTANEVYDINDCKGSKTRFHIGVLNWGSFFDLRKLGQGVTTMEECWAAAKADSKCMGMIDDALAKPDDATMTTALAFSPWLTLSEQAKNDASYGMWQEACRCGRYDHSQSLSPDQMAKNPGVSWNCILAGKDFDEAGGKDKDKKTDEEKECIEDKKQVKSQKYHAWKNLKKQRKALNKAVKAAKKEFKDAKADVDTCLED